MKTPEQLEQEARDEALALELQCELNPVVLGDAKNSIYYKKFISILEGKSVPSEEDRKFFATVTKLACNFLGYQNANQIAHVNMSLLFNVREIGSGFCIELTSVKSVDLSALKKLKIVGTDFLAGCTGIEKLDISPLACCKEIHANGFLRNARRVLRYTFKAHARRVFDLVGAYKLKLDQIQGACAVHPSCSSKVNTSLKTLEDYTNKEFGTKYTDSDWLRLQIARSAIQRRERCEFALFSVSLIAHKSKSKLGMCLSSEWIPYRTSLLFLLPV